MKYSTRQARKRRNRILMMVAVVAVAAAIAFWLGTTFAEEPMATCWTLCDPRPGSRVTVRLKPDKDSKETGYLECGDSFRTDGESRDGWVRCYGAGEGGWVYSGYVVFEKPEIVMERYVCAAKKQVACRRWPNGPQYEGRAGWLKNGENVTVFAMADGWAATSRGYIKSEWLEVDPE